MYLYQQNERMILMKRLISLLCVLTLLCAALVLGSVSASAADPAQTMVDVKSGDKVTYVLQLSDVPEGIVCVDFMFHYDSDILKLDTMADYNNDPEDWAGVMNDNTGVDGEIRGNWMVTGKKGIDFSSKRNFATLTFTAKTSGTAHISYHIRDMAGNSYFEDPAHPVITQYTFSCDVTVNGSSILKDAQPELSEVNSKDVGTFVNSVNGKSADASEPPSHSGGSGDDDNHNSDTTTPPAGPDGSVDISGETLSPSSADVTTATTADDQPKYNGQTPDEAATTGTGTTDDSSDSSGGPSPWLWIVIGGLLVIGGGGIAAYVLRSKKKQ